MSIEIKGVIIGEGKPKVCVPIVESHDEAILNKLKEFNELEVDMIELRIDFYEINRKLYFGEITFYPASGFGQFEPVTWNERLGDMIEL